MSRHPRSNTGVNPWQKHAFPRAVITGAYLPGWGYTNVQVPQAHKGPVRKTGGIP
jgi:hypothetical protein